MKPRRVFLALLLSITAFFSCYFDPAYVEDPQDDDICTVTLFIQNIQDNDTMDMCEIYVFISDTQQFRFYEPATNPEIRMRIPVGKDREFSINGYIGNIVRYKAQFLSDIDERDTTIRYTLEKFLPLPDVPGNLAAELVGSKVVKLTWDIANLAGGYGIYRSEVSTENGIFLESTSETTYNDQLGDVRKPYFYRVSAINNFGESDLSDFVEIDVPKELSTDDK